MAIVICEGLDRVGKTTIASYFSTLGFEVVHMSAPAKHHTNDSFLQEMIELVSSAATKDIFLDRSYYGEAFVWPQVYGTPQKPRKALLSEDDIEILREIEDTVGVQRLWMTDDDLKGHWQRCLDNKEPLDKAQFTRARALFSSVAQKYGFEKVTLQTFVKQFPDAQELIDKQTAANLETKTLTITNGTTVETKPGEVISTTHIKYPSSKSPEQHKLEVANAINDILSKRILKTKSSIYDDIENEMRLFLNTKLGKLLGGVSGETSLNSEEIKFYKEMYKRAINKGAQ